MLSLALLSLGRHLITLFMRLVFDDSFLPFDPVELGDALEVWFFPVVDLA